MFPEERLGELDATLLAKMGLTKKRIQEKDALFFFISYSYPCANLKNQVLEVIKERHSTVTWNLSLINKRFPLVWAGLMAMPFNWSSYLS
jgi:hypothetical protein